MVKSSKILILLFLFINLNLSASKISNKSYFEIGFLSIATVPPTVKSTIYYCQNSVAVPLTATSSSPTAIFRWYDALTLGNEFPSAPTPSTTTVGTTPYYVSETVGSSESTRSKIDVIVVADTGVSIQNFTCAPWLLTTGPSAIPPTPLTSVAFDWSNIVGHPPNAYNFTYTIQGGMPVSGNANNSSVEIFNVLPGESVTLTITSVVAFPCVPIISQTCILPCGAASRTPTFSAIPTTYCIDEVTMPPLLPTTSSNAITGAWNPSEINTTTAGTTNYIFTPDPILFPCATKQTLSVTVGPIEPDFIDFSICSGELRNLNSTSPNGITGTWSPPTIDNTTSRAYIFTPNPGQLCTPTVKTINVTVNPSDAIVILKWDVTAAFSKNQIVTVTEPVGVNYLYQLDDGPFQVSTVFENVSLGTHSVTVKDVNGCSELRNDNVLVIDYPKFFTPNHDNYNDTWNIFSLRDVLNARILIFDRYGKLLKEINPKGLGWDGTYIDKPMPANDYWFTVEYTEQNIAKIFKSHFSLKR